MRLTKLLKVLSLCTVVTLSCLSPVAGSLQAQSQNANTIAGSWIVQVISDDGEPPFINLTTATNDGRLINVATDGLAGLGEWQKTAAGSFAVTFLHVTEQDGQRLRIKIRATL